MLPIRLESIPAADIGFRFPAVKGAALSGQSVQIPSDLEGRAQIIVVSFEAWQRELIRSWRPLLERVSREFRGVSVYEVPLLPLVSAFSRSVVASSMRAERDSVDAVDHTIMVHADKDALRARLGIVDEHTIHLFLVDLGGRVCWRGSDALDVDSQASLFAEVARLVPQGH